MQFGLFVSQLSDVPTMVDAGRSAPRRAASIRSGSSITSLRPGAPAQTPILEGWITMTALAAKTSRIRLGQLVGANPFRHPAVLAKMAATLDQVSEGRLDLGLGWGSIDAEFETFGVPLGTRRERAEQLGETIEILRLMFAGEPFDYNGKHFMLKGAVGLPKPVQPNIPILIGGAGKQLTMPLVAKYADWWNCVTSARAQLDELAPLRGNARLSVQYPVAMVHPGDNLDEVRAKVERRMPAAGWGEPVIGTGEELRSFFASEAERGVELAILRFHDVAAERTLQAFGRDVINPG